MRPSRFENTHPVHEGAGVSLRPRYYSRVTWLTAGEDADTRAVRGSARSATTRHNNRMSNDHSLEIDYPRGPLQVTLHVFGQRMEQPQPSVGVCKTPEYRRCCDHILVEIPQDTMSAIRGLDQRSVHIVMVKASGMRRGLLWSHLCPVR